MGTVEHSLVSFFIVRRVYECDESLEKYTCTPILNRAVPNGFIR